MATETSNVDLSALRIDRTMHDEPPPSRARTIVKIVIGVAIAGAIIAGVLYFPKLMEAPPEVQLATASFSSPSQANAVLTASGYVVAQRKAAVASKATGRLVFLGVEEGDRVKENQIIARIEDSDVVASLNQARANLAVNQADLRDAQKWFDRQKSLLSRGLGSQSDYDASETLVKRVGALIVSTKAAVTGAEVAVENTRVRAPFDGTVLLKHADVGEIVAPFGAASNSRGSVVTMADMSSLQVEADVSESNIERIITNLPCEITLDAYPDQRYQGFVNKIVPTADRAKATVQVKVKFKSYDARVLPEMSAKVVFLSKEPEKSDQNAKSIITVPASAVATRGGQQVVFVVKEGKVLQTAVTVGKNLGSMVEIQQGISQGERVITKVDDRIQDGMKVTVK